MRTDLLRRRPRAGRAATIAAAGALLLLLAGCSPMPASGSAPAASTPSSPSPATPSATPTAALLACTDLATDAEIAAALSEPRAAVTPTSAPDASLIGARSVEGAGGLSCARSTPQTSAELPSRRLTVSVLPDAAGDWSGQLYGDAPSKVRRTFAGVSAAADCGDPGCGASMVVGTSWVRVDLLANGTEIDGSAFGSESTDTVFGNARRAIESVISAVQQASPAQLAFPAHLPASSGTVRCESFLSTAALAGAMGVTSATYDTRYQPTGLSDSIVGAAEHRIGVRDCFVQGSGSSPSGTADIRIAPGQAWAVADLAGDPAARGGLTATTLTGMTSGERALTDCKQGGTTSCTVVFTLGDDAIEIDFSTRPARIAEAIIAQAR